MDGKRVLKRSDVVGSVLPVRHCRISPDASAVLFSAVLNSDAMHAHHAKEAPTSGHLPPSQRQLVRGIAVFEAVKGLAALLSAIGLAELLHHDLHQLVLELVGHFGLKPTQSFPHIVLHYADVLNRTPIGTLEILLCSYATLRLTEAYGLWNESAWGAWLGALSGGLYVPFELRHLWHDPSAIGASVLAINLLLVAFLAMQLWRKRG